MQFKNFFVSWKSNVSFLKYSIFQILIISIKFESRNVMMTEATTGGVPIKKVFLKIAQNLQENTCARVSFLIKKFFLFYRTPPGDCLCSRY